MKMVARRRRDREAAGDRRDAPSGGEPRALGVRLLVDGLVPLAVLVGVAMWFGQRWLGPGLPGGDFGGNTACVWYLNDTITNSGGLPGWSRWWFCGQPTTLVQPGLFGGLLAFLPFALFYDAVEAIKVGSLVYFGLAGFCMYHLLLNLSGSRAAGYLGGLFYAIHPIHLSVVAWTGHPNFAPFYLWPPLVFLCLLRLGRRITYGRTALLGLVVAGMLASDIERAVTCLLPAIAGALVYARLVPGQDREDRAGHFWRYVGALAAAGAIAVLLSAAFLGPVVVESGSFTLFSPEVREESVRYFSLQNPLHLLDRGGVLAGRWSGFLPGEFLYNRGFLYLSVVLVGVAGISIALAKTEELRRLAVAALVMTIAAAWLAGGMYSIYDRLVELGRELYSRADYLQRRPIELPILVGAAVLFAAGLAVWRRLRQKKQEAVSDDGAALSVRSLLVPCGIVALVFTSPAVFFEHAPFLDHMRSPSWFMSFGPSLGLCVAAAIVPAVLRARGWGPFATGAAAIVAGLLYVGDVVPYRRAFHAMEPSGVYRDLRGVAEFLADRAEKEEPFRVLSRETYNPRADTQLLWSGVPQVWSWLNWASPRHLGDLFLKEIFPKLHRPETIDESLRLAGLAGVKYVIYDLTEGPPPPNTELLDRVLETEHFLVYENRAAQPLVRFFPGTQPDPDDLLLERSVGESFSWTRQRPSDNEIVVTVQAPARGTLVLSESWHPGWNVELDGQPASLVRAQKAFQGVVVTEGKHEVRFSYSRPWYFAVCGWASLLGLLGICWLGVPRCRDWVATRWRRWRQGVRSGIRRVWGDGSRARARRDVVALVLLLAAAGVVRFYHLAGTPRWFADEGAHVMIARGLLEGQSRMQALRLSWSDSYHCYPPGFDLLVAAAMGIFGPHVLAARAVTALAGLITVAAVWGIGRRVAGPLAGWGASVAIAFHPLTVLFHRWGFAATVAGLGAALAFGLALRVREQPTRGRAAAAFGAALAAMAFSYWSAPILLFVLYVVLTTDRRLARRVLAVLLGASAALVVILALSGGLGTLSDRVLATARLAISGQESWIGPSEAAKAGLVAFGQWLAVDWLLALGTAGLLLAPAGWARRDLVMGFLLLGGMPILLRADIMANFFYNALIFVPLVFVGLGCLLNGLAQLLERLAGALPEIDVRAVTFAAVAGGIVVTGFLFVETILAGHDGWRTRIDGFCEQDPAAAQEVAGWIDRQTGSGDFVIATHTVGWLLESRSAHLLQVTARAGWPTTWMIKPPSPDRFAFDCALENARFLWVDPTVRYWAAWQPNVDRVLHQLEESRWPLVFRRGRHEVYANPRWWNGPSLAEEVLVIRVPPIYQRLGDRFMHEGRYEDALAAYLRLIHLAPGEVLALNNAAVAAARLQNWSQAQALWEEVLRLDPEMLAARAGLEAIGEHTGSPTEDTKEEPAS